MTPIPNVIQNYLPSLALNVTRTFVNVLTPIESYQAADIENAEDKSATSFPHSTDTILG